MRSKERQDIIMGKLVEDYVATSQPVSSNKLVDNIGMNVSSATIRNDLMKLEQDGYVQHLHTSSGRVPTDKGYRLYVDKLMVFPDISEEEKLVIKEVVSSVHLNINQLLLATAEILSDLSDYPVIIVTDNFKQNTLKFVQLVLLNMHQIMFSMLDNYGDYYQEIMELPYNTIISQQELNKLSEYLNNICGECPVVSVEELYSQSLGELSARFSSYGEVLRQISKVLERGRSLLSDNKVISKKSNKLYSHPEFQKIEALKNVHSVLEDEAKVVKLFSDMVLENNGDIKAVIGKENKNIGLEDTSFVAGKVTIGEKDVVGIGVIGPTRMKYGNVFAQINNVIKSLDDKVKKIFI